MKGHIETASSADGQLPPWATNVREIWQRASSLPHVFKLASEVRVGTSPCDVVMQRHTHRLLRYRRQNPARYAPPVLFCYALINRPYILDLQDDRSVVRQYLNAGFDVFIIDWGVPTDADRGLNLEHYVCGFLVEAVEAVRRESGRDALHLLGYCMGGTMSALFAALWPRLVKSLTLLATPVDFSGRDSLLSVWSDPNFFDVDAFIANHGNCPAWFLQTCFLHTRPVQSFLEKNITFYEQMSDPLFVANYFAMEKWVNDNIPVAGATFREFVKNLYQKNQLVRGELEIGGRRIDLRRIECPILLVTAKNDHLVPPSSTENISRYVGTEDIRSLSTEGGHVGLVVGHRAHRTLWPEATRWLVERSTLRPTAAEAVSPSEGRYANATD